MKRILIGLMLLVFPALAFADAVYVGPACKSTSPSSCTQSRASAAGNEPTASTPGVSLVNACGLTVVLTAYGLDDAGTNDDGQKVDGGTLRFWYKSPLVGRYAENTSVSIPIPSQTNRRDVVIESLDVPVAYGTVYVEAENVITTLPDAGPAGTVTVSVETMSCRATR